MPRHLYASNFDSGTTEAELRQLFEPYGKVERISIQRDTAGGRSRVFALVDMVGELDAEDAIDALNGMLFRDRTLIVKEAPSKVVKLQICEGCGKARPILYLALLPNPKAVHDPEEPLFRGSINLCEDCRGRAEEIYDSKPRKKNT